MRRQREEDNNNNNVVIDITETDDESSNNGINNKQQTIPPSTTTEEKKPVAVNSPTVDQEIMSFLNALFDKVKNENKSKVQKPLFFAQRVKSTEKELAQNNIKVLVGKQMINQLNSTFIAFVAIGITSQEKLRVFEKYVKTLISFVAPAAKPAHPFIVVSKCLSEKWTKHDMTTAASSSANNKKVLRQETCQQLIGSVNNANNNSTNKTDNNNQNSLLSSVTTVQDDDGEEFGDMHLEKALNGFLGRVGYLPVAKEKNITRQQLLREGIAVCVSRWFGGVLLGPARFDHIKDCATSALNEALNRESFF